MKVVLCVKLSLVAIFLFSSCLFSNGPSGVETKPELTPLESYISVPDTSYHFELRNTIPGEGFTTYVLFLQSQRWLSEREVKNPLWWHWLTIVVPDEVKSDIGMLYIGGGDRNNKMPESANQLLVQSALATQTITADLHNIPNQPMEFIGDDFGPRVEDELIAYGWRHYLEGGAKEEDAIWLARLPMTKAVVRAMDAVTAFCQDERQQPVNRYTILGASKRGWTTWTTAIVDDRVIAIAPIVIDLLNVIPSFEHHWKAYGAWAPAVGDYVREGIMEWQRQPEYRQLVDLVEPYSYRERLNMPKFLINAGSDEFFLPDSWQFYWNDLVGEKHLRYIANSGHSLAGTDAIESFLAFYQAIVNNQPRPDYDWQVEKGAIVIKTDPTFPPDSIWLWQANNPNARDFRVDVIGRTWKSQAIAISPKGQYQISVEQPDEGWTAFFVELKFPGPGTLPYKFSTGIVVVPEELPYPPFEAQAKRD